MRHVDKTEEQAMAVALLDWFRRSMRALPWRRTYDPYEVWIAEVMLQQTQMERAVGYFQRWMERFPDVAAIAAASEEEVLSAWEGLGYYRRARFVHAAARAICERHGGRIPSGKEALQALPGLGAYTVAAILGIAFNQDVVVVDANVERVFTRLLNIDAPPKKHAAAALIGETARRLLPPGHAREYNEALMELGELVCRKVPLCAGCPWAAWCESRRLGVEKQRPVSIPRPARVSVCTGHGVLMHKGCVLLVKRPETGLWGALWEFPGGEQVGDESPARAAERAFAALGLDVQAGDDLGSVRHGYTNHRLTARFFRMAAPSGVDMAQAVRALEPCADVRLVPCREIGALAMPAHHRKLADRFFSRARRQGDPREQGSLLENGR
ncbi:MAG: A/G-specific adenine glycosylase [Desulfovibrionaceae bacterium]|nr:A/G-specific adenine glycosylase [Desulfovibrionaceae bacterium]